jgi:hypothetical protein
MKRAIRHITLAVLAASLALALVVAAGCSANKNFVYKPNPPAADARMRPVKVAVLPFEDGTENFTYRGELFGKGQYNLGKAGVAGGMAALPPSSGASPSPTSSRRPGLSGRPVSSTAGPRSGTRISWSRASS